MWILETARLALRQFTSDDVDNLMQIFGDPEAMRFYLVPFDREKTAGWIRWSLNSCEQNGFGLWAVIRKQDQLFLGDCGPMLQPGHIRPVFVSIGPVFVSSSIAHQLQQLQA